MRLSNQQIYNFLIGQDITHLHHANSLATALTFIRSGGLLSRGAVEARNLFQTTQLSDNDDKRNGVWNDVFFDTKDLHGVFPRQNLYGPVLLQFNISLLLDSALQIFITKNNPMFWNNATSEQDKYFQGMEDVMENWSLYPLQRKMITIRFQNDPIQFNQLEAIIVDDPRVIIYNDTTLFDVCWATLNEEVRHHLYVLYNVQLRACSGNCFCRSNYLNQYPTDRLSKFFLPINHFRFINSNV
jgi:hypothetical protein